VGTDAFKSLFGNTSRDWKRVSLVESKDIRHWNFFRRTASSQENSWFASQTLRNSHQAIEVNFPIYRQAIREPGTCSFNKINELSGTAAFSALPNANAVQSRLQEPTSTAVDDIAIIADPHRTKDFLKDQNSQDVAWLKNMLIRFGWKDCAAWLIHSCYPKSGSIFTKITPSGFFEYRKFHHKEFKECLCLRLMLPQIPLPTDHQMDTYICCCAASVHLLKNRFHCLGCTRFQGTFNTRHKKVVDCLANAMATDKDPLLQILGSPHSTSAEVTLATIPSPADDYGFLPRRDDHPDRRADLGFLFGPTDVHHIVDVAVMAPTCASYINEGNTHMMRNGAHHIIEGKKAARYLSHTEPTTPLPVTYSLIPFIVDCTGNFGDKTANFFEAQHMPPGRQKATTRAVRALMDEWNARLRSIHTKYGIPAVDPNVRMRVNPNEERPRRRGRPIGSRNRNSRGRRNVAMVQEQQAQQAALIITSNSPNAITSDSEEVDDLMPTEASSGEVDNGSRQT
jgi:hypothetical protein